LGVFGNVFRVVLGDLLGNQFFLEKRGRMKINKNDTKEEIERSFMEMVSGPNPLPEALRFVPERWRTKVVCELAFIRDERNVDHVPCHLLNNEMALKKIGRHCHTLEWIYMIPEESWSFDLAVAALVSNGGCLEFIPKKWLNEDVFLAVVESMLLGLSRIPMEYQTQKVVEAALKKNLDNSKYIKIKEMFKNALEEALNE